MPVTAIERLDGQCRVLRRRGVPVRTYCGTYITGEAEHHRVHLTYGVEVMRSADDPLRKLWKVDRRDQPASLEAAAGRAHDWLQEQVTA